MMVIFLVGLVSMILMRTLRKDYARYSKDDELDDMVSYRNYPYRDGLMQIERQYYLMYNPNVLNIFIKTITAYI